MERKFWSEMAKRTDPYIPGLQVNDQQIIKLNTNENPYPPSPRVIEAIQAEVGKLPLYPSPTADALRQTIGEFYGLDQENVFIGNGSDEVLAFSFMAFFNPDKAIRYPAITYSFYPVYAKLFNIPVEEIDLNEDFTIPVEAFFESEGGVIFPNPNAPTSIYLPLDDVRRILENNRDQVVIVDEAYIDFAGSSAATLVKEYENLLVIQTTSKSRSLAGLRVGFALGQPSLIQALVSIKDSFNSYTIDRLALVGAQASFEDVDYFRGVTKRIITTRKRVSRELDKLGFNGLPSDANFVFATHPDYDASVLYDRLFKEGFLVRHFNSERIDQYLRITIGTDEEMEQFLATLKRIIS